MDWELKFYLKWAIFVDAWMSLGRHNTLCRCLCGLAMLSCSMFASDRCLGMLAVSKVIAVCDDKLVIDTRYQPMTRFSSS